MPDIDGPLSVTVFMHNGQFELNDEQFAELPFDLQSWINWLWVASEKLPFAEMTAWFEGFDGPAHHKVMLTHKVEPGMDFNSLKYH